MCWNISCNIFVIYMLYIRLSVRDDSRGLMGDVAMDLMSDDKQTMMKNKNAMRYESNASPICRH